MSKEITNSRVAAVAFAVNALKTGDIDWSEHVVASNNIGKEDVLGFVAHQLENLSTPAAIRIIATMTAKEETD